MSNKKKLQIYAFIPHIFTINKGNCEQFGLNITVNLSHCFTDISVQFCSFIFINSFILQHTVL